MRVVNVQHIQRRVSRMVSFTSRAQRIHRHDRFGGQYLLTDLANSTMRFSTGQRRRVNRNLTGITDTSGRRLTPHRTLTLATIPLTLSLTSRPHRRFTLITRRMDRGMFNRSLTRGPRHTNRTVIT